MIFKQKAIAHVGSFKPEAQVRLLRRISFAGLFCSACFIIRTFFVLIQIKITSLISNRILELVYFVLLEILPLVLMLGVIFVAALNDEVWRGKADSYKPKRDTSPLLA